MNFNVITDQGYLANPYRSVRYLDPSNAKGYSLASQVYPDTRTSTAVQVEGKYYLPYRAAVTASYRYFRDTWGIVGNTYELDYTHPISNVWILEGRFRYYKQNHANFYSDLFPYADEYASRPRPGSRGAGQLHHRRQGDLCFSAERLEIFKRATVTFDISRITFHYLDFTNIKYYGVQAAVIPAGRRTAVPVQRHRVAALHVDVLLTGFGDAAPPDQQHGRERGNDGEGIRHPIPEIPVAVHDGESLNELDECAECRQQRAMTKRLRLGNAAAARPVSA